MPKLTHRQRMILKLPVINIERPLKLDRPVVVIPEEEYRELMEDISDLRGALKAEEDYLSKGGRLFADYDKERRGRKQR